MSVAGVCGQFGDGGLSIPDRRDGSSWTACCLCGLGRGPGVDSGLSL